MLNSKASDVASETYLNFPADHVDEIGPVVSHKRAMDAAIKAYLEALLSADVKEVAERLLDPRRMRSLVGNPDRFEAAALLQAVAAENDELRDLVTRAQLNVPEHYLNWHSDAARTLSKEGRDNG